MPHDIASRHHDPRYTPPLADGPARVRLGGASLDVERSDGGRVALRVGTEGGDHAWGHARSSDVLVWCGALRMLVDAKLALQPADEVELRSPMLVAEGIGCLALWRWLGGSESTLRLLLAQSPEQLVAGDETAVLFVTEAEVRELTTALLAAASA
jgi:hypothetical protein